MRPDELRECNTRVRDELRRTTRLNAAQRRRVEDAVAVVDACDDVDLDGLSPVDRLDALSLQGTIHDLEHLLWTSTDQGLDALLPTIEHLALRYTVTVEVAREYIDKPLG